MITNWLAGAGLTAMSFDSSCAHAARVRRKPEIHRLGLVVRQAGKCRDAVKKRDRQSAPLETGCSDIAARRRDGARAVAR